MGHNNTMSIVIELWTRGERRTVIMFPWKLDILMLGVRRVTVLLLTGASASWNRGVLIGISRSDRGARDSTSLD